MELEHDDETDVAGYLRFKGPSLEAGRTFQIRVDKGVPAEPAEDLFTQPVPAEESSDTETAAGEEADQGLPLAVKVAPIIILIIILASRRRRRSK